MDQKNKSWFWVPSLYYAEGLPYAFVMIVSVVMYKKLDISNSEIALYTSSASLDATTTAYSSTNEVSASGSYTAGGGSLTSVTPTTSGTTALCDFSDISFTSATITARGAVIYNSSNSNKAVCVLNFGGDKTSTSGTFTVQFPTADASNAILRLA